MSWTLGPADLSLGSVGVHPTCTSDVRALYQRLIHAGKPKMSAAGAAMRKLVQIAFGVFKHQQPYPPQNA